MAPPTRRLGGWGFAEERFAPPPRLGEWLERQIGPARHPLADAPPPAPDIAPEPLPELPLALSDEPGDRLAHARGQGLPDLIRLRCGRVPALPDGVARPTDADQVEATLRACVRSGVRVIPWGGGTSVTGGVNVTSNTAPVLTLDLERIAGLNRLDEASGLATFGPGTCGPAVEAALADLGLTLGHFPQSWELSTVGGWVVTRSAGQESLGYGRIDDLTAGFELVAPAGRLELPALPGSAAGPDLRRLVLGSEGRLGVVTRATLRVRPRPEETRVEGALLPDLGYATDTLETATPWATAAAVHETVAAAIARALEPEQERVAVMCHSSHPYRDGTSLYFTLFFRCAADPDHTLHRWASIKRTACEALLECGATLSHHHGVGQWHAPWYEREVGRHGRLQVESAARQMDPDGILNPQVLLDSDDRLEV